MKIVEQSFTIEYPTRHIHGLMMLEDIADAARVSHKSEGTDNKGLVKRLIEWGHFSSLRHGHMRVRIVTDRATSHQLVRHHVGFDVVQESQRYVQYENLEVICPESILAHSNPTGRYFIYNCWREPIAKCEAEYKRLVMNGISPEDARSVLPNATATTLVCTGNIEAWRHIFEMRCTEHAQESIRTLMLGILKEASEKIPVVFDDLLERFIN